MMPEQTLTSSWKRRAPALLRAVVFVACYLIVFVGLLYTVAVSS